MLSEIIIRDLISSSSYYNIHNLLLYRLYSFIFPLDFVLASIIRASVQYLKISKVALFTNLCDEKLRHILAYSYADRRQAGEW